MRRFVTVTCKTLPRYEDGSVVRWIGTAESDSPSLERKGE